MKKVNVKNLAGIGVDFVTKCCGTKIKCACEFGGKVVEGISKITANIFEHAETTQADIDMRKEYKNHPDIEKINEEIRMELSKENPDFDKINRLEEEREKLYNKNWYCEDRGEQAQHNKEIIRSVNDIFKTASYAAIGCTAYYVVKKIRK